MKLLSVMTARVIWLFDLNDLNPTGKSIYADLLDWLKDEYQFAKSPKSLSESDDAAKGWVFSEGEYQAKEEIWISVDLTVFNDGLVANSRSSTKDTEAFLEDVVESAAQSFSLTFNDSMIRRKLYVSEINVRLDGSFSHLNPVLDKFGARVSSALSFEPKPTFQFSGLGFGPDPAPGAFNPVGLVIERKVGAPFSENRYYSKSPLSTEEHLRLLAEFEELIK